MIHVCFGLYDKTGRYSKFTGTTMCSLFENATPPPTSITVHILHDNTLTQDNRDKFIYLTGRYGQAVKFYNVDELCADRIAEINILIPSAKTSQLSIAALYRLLIPQIISADIEKVIYLDSDIIVNLDITELWQIELNDKSIAAVAEAENDPLDYPRNAKVNYLVKNNLVSYNDYFNSGVLLINLNSWRNEEELISDGIKYLSEHPQLIYLDQEVLNYIYSKSYLKLPAKFNALVRSERFVEKTPQARKKIYHYNNSNGGQGIALNLSDNLNRLWIKYFMKTPWFDEDSIGRLYEGVEQMHGGLKSSMLNLSAMMSGKTRAFFVTPQDVDMIKKAFSVQTNEDIILAENQESIKKLIKAMKRSQGKKIFFITMLIFPYNVLINEGFVFGKDFLNGAEFLLGFNSYLLIKDM